MAGDKALFTGDCLFIGDCGRTDLPGGNNKELFESMRRLKQLPDGLTVYPGHDYGTKSCDTLGSQKKVNKCLRAETPEEFSALQ
jgi:hydroxyacylglutathione hydrolase